MGHHVGGDASDYYGELQAFLPWGVTLTASIDVERRGESGPVEEKHTQPAMALSWARPDGFTLELAYAYDRVRNFNYEDGNDRDFHLLHLGGTKRW